MKISRLELFLLSVLLVPCWVIASRYDIDLVNLHVAAGFTHTDLSRVYAQNGNYGRWFYPPFSLVLIHPLGALPYTLVKWFWICLQTLAYVVFWYGLYRLYPLLKEKAFFWSWLLLFILAINPIHNNYQSNNVQLMLMAVLVMAEVLSTRSTRNQLLSGVLVSFATWFKVFPVFVALYYFLFKPLKVKMGVVIGFLIGLLLPSLVFGWDNSLQLYRDFYYGVTTYANENSLTKTPDIMCLPSLLERVFTFLIPLSSHKLALITKGTTVFISGCFFILTFLAGPSLGTWALALALTVFLNPSTRPHYFIFYVPAMASLLEIQWKHRALWGRSIVLLALGLIAFTTDAVLGKSLNDQAEFFSLPTIGSGLLVAYLGWEILGNQSTYLCRRCFLWCARPFRRLFSPLAT